jgi:hypothetical protein
LKKTFTAIQNEDELFSPIPSRVAAKEIGIDDPLSIEDDPNVLAVVIIQLFPNRCFIKAVRIIL